ncbi:MAG TPA: serine kinase [Telmatospirillum sp.]|nr:serine kinase [Telmatospirillum sp.]
MIQTHNAQAEDRLFYGYRLRTDLLLPSLPSMSREGAEDIELRVGDVPAQLSAATWRSPFVEIGADSDVLARVGERIRFLIRDGRQVIINEAPPSRITEIETLLHGVVAGILLHQRGDLALHASCVVIGDRAVAIAGPGGRGKSTLAAVLVAQGYPLLTDDVCRVRFANGSAWAMPGSSRLRLWPDAARTLGHAPDTLAVGRPGHLKRQLPSSLVSTNPIRLGAILRLGVDSRQDTPSLVRLSGLATVIRSDEVLYRARLGRLLGRKVSLFEDLTRLLALVPMFSLTRTERSSDLSDMARLVISAASDDR